MVKLLRKFFLIFLTFVSIIFLLVQALLAQTSKENAKGYEAAGLMAQLEVTVRPQAARRKVQPAGFEAIPASSPTGVDILAVGDLNNGVIALTDARQKDRPRA